jgi:type II secretion system protein C
MSSAQQGISSWKWHAPLCVAAALACVGALELARGAWSLYRLGDAPAATAPGLAEIPGLRPVDVPHLVNAHLFGEPPPAAASNPSTGAQPRSANDLSLTGIVAMPDPSAGYAMLGRKSEATRLYRAGMNIQGLPDGRLYQVFADHVVLEISGLFESLKLPSAKLAGSKSVDLTHVRDVEKQADGGRATLETKLQPVNFAQTLFADLEAEQNNVNGHAAGMLLHPSRAYQRRYGVHDGDVLTSVNGISITDAEALGTVLSSSGAQSLTLTYVRDGQQHTIGMGVSN